LQDWQAGGEFSVNLTTVLDCLHILGTQSLDKTKLSLSYNLHTEVFQLELLEDGGVLATAAIPGMAPPTATGESLALAFRSAPITSRVIVTSDWLRDAMQELELVPGATTCIIAIASHGLELLVLGTLGACVITIPGQCCVSLECGMAPTTTTGGGDGQARSYPMSSVIRAMQGLDYAHETCISINDNGMIAIQHQILDNVGQGSPNFVDFIMSCLIPEDDDGDGDGDGDISTTTSGRGTQEYTTSSFRSTNSQIMEPYHRYSSAVHNPSDDDNDNYDDEQDDDDNDLPTISSVPLFGTVFNETNHRPSTSRNVRRRVRRRHDDDSSKEKTKDTTDANE
jgi:hypothetical protein